MSPYPRLFSELQMAGYRLRNRVVHASITTHCTANPATHAKLLGYFRNRAAGGAAAIVTEPLGIAPHQPASRLRAFDDSMQDFGKRWAEATEPFDCRLLAQIQDTGRGRHHPGRAVGAIGASASPDDLSLTMPHAMTRRDIKAFVEHAADSAARLRRWGFSGVEVSAAHGHLFHQFLSPQSNGRDDDYGGSLENRLRFVVELCLALRSALGGDRILGIKLPGNDGVPGGIGPELAAQTASHIAGCVKLDYIAYAQGAHHRSLEMHIPNDSYPRVVYGQMIKTLAAATPDIPIMALGRITDPAEAEALLEDGKIALIGLGRPLIADPGWPRKAAAGRARDIRYCVNHNSCWEIGQQAQAHPLVCDNNPQVGLPGELEFKPTTVSQRKKVVVVGAGVAGMEAAWIAAARGHEVLVFGASGETGGKLRLQASLPNSESLSSVYDFQSQAATKHGVKLELGVTVDAQAILRQQPDVVILATGGTMVWPKALPAGLREEGIVTDLRQAIAALLHHKGRRQPGTAVIYDLDHTIGTYNSAELLHQTFERAVVITPRDRLAEDAALVTRQTVHRRFHELGIAYRCLVEPVWSDQVMDEGKLEIESVYGGGRQQIDQVSFFSFATPRAPNIALLPTLEEAGVEVRVIGDANEPRQLAFTTLAGFNAGNSV